MVGQIAKAAETDAGEAMTLATYGFKPTPAQRAVWKYLSHHKEKGWKPGTAADYDLGGPAYFLCQLFLEAVNKRDFDTLRDIATALKKPQLYDVNHSGPYMMYSQDQDSRKLEILKLGRMLDHFGERFTAKQLAGWLVRPLGPIGMPGLDKIKRQAEAQAPPTDDNYRALRRIAKSLKFPFAKTGRPKKVVK